MQIRAFHATEAEFDRFDTSAEGAHFGTQNQASNLKPLRDRRLIEVELTLKNPLRVPDLGTWSFSGIIAQLRRQGSITAEEADQAHSGYNTSDVAGWRVLKEILLAHGHDAFVYANEAEGEGDSYVAFYPEQIRVIAA